MTDTHTHRSTNPKKCSTKQVSRRLEVIAALCIGITLSMPAAAKLYKWVDDNGTTHYGETIPPKYANKSRSELSKSGRIVESITILSPEQRRAEREKEEEIAAQEQREKRANQEKVRRDRMLVNTYSSVAEIDLARNRNLRQIELRINSLLARIKITNENLQDLQTEADGYANKKRKIPLSLKADLTNTEARLETLREDLGKPSTEKDALEARYDEDEKRYRELTGK